jgi:hypothetical protein
MSRSRTMLPVLAWLVGGIACGQGLPVAPPAAEYPMLESGVFLQPSQPTPATPPAAGQPAAGKADPAKAAATLEELGKTVETLGKNLTVVTGDEKVKLILGGVINADFY